MIRKFNKTDLDVIMQIWISSNIETHHFISKLYWESNYEMVKRILPDAEVYVYEDTNTNEILGFIGLMDNHIAGLFVKENSRSQGIGKRLLDYVKTTKDYLTLSAYKKNFRAVRFYQREQFVINAESIDKNTGEIEWVLSWNK